VSEERGKGAWERGGKIGDGGRGKRNPEDSLLGGQQTRTKTRICLERGKAPYRKNCYQGEKSQGVKRALGTGSRRRWEGGGKENQKSGDVGTELFSRSVRESGVLDPAGNRRWGGNRQRGTSGTGPAAERGPT